jgi:hypothetical protein
MLRCAGWPAFCQEHFRAAGGTPRGAPLPNGASRQWIEIAPAGTAGACVDGEPSG